MSTYDEISGSSPLLPTTESQELEAQAVQKTRRRKEAIFVTLFAVIVIYLLSRGKTWDRASPYKDEGSNFDGRNVTKWFGMETGRKKALCGFCSLNGKERYALYEVEGGGFIGSWFACEKAIGTSCLISGPLGEISCSAVCSMVAGSGLSFIASQSYQHLEDLCYQNERSCRYCVEREYCGRVRL